MRSRAAKPKENLYKASLQTKLRYDSEAVVDDFPRDQPPQLDEVATNKSLLSKLNPFKKRQMMPNLMKRHSMAPGFEFDPQQYLRNTQTGRASVSSLSKNYLTSNQQRRQSLFPIPSADEEQDLLETTTVADLIRAIEQVHTDNAMQDDDMQDVLGLKKTRKLGTDHLTPPRHQSLLTLERQQSSHTIHGPSSDILPMKPLPRNRLYSVSATMDNYDNSRGKILGDANPFYRRSSIRPPPPYTTTPPESLSLKPALKRRFSVRPSNLDKAPGQFHTPKNSQITATQQLTTPFQRKLSWRPTPSSLAQSNEVSNKNARQKTDSTSFTKPT